MDLKLLLSFALGLLFLSSPAFAGLPPTTLSGQSDASKTTTFNFVTPNHQATPVTGGTLIETGNKNLLKNGSFENKTATEGWTVTPTAIPMSEAPHGVKSVCFSPASEPVEIYQDTVSNTSAFVNGVLTGRFSGKYKTNIEGLVACPRNNGSVTSDCVALDNTDFKWDTFENYFDLGSVSNGVSIHSTGNVNGAICLDEVHMGMDEELHVGTTQESDSYLRLNTSNGYGSTGTRIRRFLNSFQKGQDFLYVDSPTAGASITILNEGLYNINYTDSFSAAENLGISKDASSLTTDLNSLSVDERLSMETTVGANLAGTTSATVYLQEGAVIRPHTNAIGTTGIAARAAFSISRPGSLKALKVNKNQKIKIPTSRVRFDGATTRGSSGIETGTVKFDVISKLSGNAFSIDSTNGTRVTLKESGLVCSAGMIYAASSGYFYVTKNQTTTTPQNTEYVTGSGGGSAPVGGLGGCFDVEVGDVLRVNAPSGNPTSAANTWTLYFQKQEVQVSVSNTLPQYTETDTYIRAIGSAGYGSTATKIRRFSSIPDNYGTDATCIDSATLGYSCTVVTDGTYTITYSDQISTTSAYIGISKNASSLTTNIWAMPNSEVLAIDTISVATANSNVVWQGKLSKGDIVRPHTDGNASSGSQPVSFSISKVAKSNMATVDVTPFVDIEYSPDYARTQYVPVFTGVTSTVNDCYHSRDGEFLEVDCKFTVASSSATEMRVSLPVVNGIQLTSAASTGIRIAGNLSSTEAGTAIVNNLLIEPSVSYFTFGVRSSGTANAFTKLLGSNYVTAGTIVAFTARIPISQWNSLEDTVITPTQSFSTDTASLVYQPSTLYTLATLPNAPVGSFITYSYAGGTNTRTQCGAGQAPTQTVEDMKVNGIQMFTRVLAATSTCAQPTVLAINIGKGHKGVTKTLYKTTGKPSVTASLEKFLISTTEYGFIYKDYSESTGVLLMDSGAAQTGMSSSLFAYNDIASTTNGYLTINASKTPTLAALPTGGITTTPGVARPVMREAFVASASPGACAVTGEDAEWVSGNGVAGTAGMCTLTITGFTSTPKCWAQVNVTNTNPYYCSARATSATSIVLQAVNGSTVSNSIDCIVFCKGNAQ